jgi:Zn-dependent peptidase ImmA (M78 family)
MRFEPAQSPLDVGIFGRTVARIEQVNRERIEWCCTDYGMSVQDLAAEIGMAQASMQAVIAGEQLPTFAQLERIARFFGRGVLFFLEPGEPEIEQVHTTQFRTLANQKPNLAPKMRALIERTERQREIYISLREELGEHEYPEFAPPQLEGMSISDAAAVVRRWLRFTGAENSFEGYRSKVEAAGVLVFRSNGYSGKWQIPREVSILGFSLFDPRCPLIVVRKEKWESRQTFTLMHELGHLLLHRTSSIDDDHDMHANHDGEQEANAFAGHLLVPDAYLRQISDQDRPADVAEYDEWLSDNRELWGVSTEVILRRLLDAGRLDRANYAAYRAWWSRWDYDEPEAAAAPRIYRHREPKHIFGNRFVRLVFDALGSERITLARASTYLDSLKISDLRELERHCAGV